MEVDKAIQAVINEFPFKGYMTPEGVSNGAYSNISTTVLRYLPLGSAILDFGSGPCDKTAVLQLLGYCCSAYDDLEDDWHKISGNREKIIEYANQCGIDLKLANGEMLPFQKNSFDMVMLHDVLEHLHNSPRALLNDLLELTKPDGLLFVTVPNAANIRKRLAVLLGKTNLPCFEDYYWYPGPFRGHVREYVLDDLHKLANYLNLDILEVRGCDHMLQKVPCKLRYAYLFITKYFTGWKDSWLLVARKKTGWSAKKTLPQNELAKILGKTTTYDYSK